MRAVELHGSEALDLDRPEAPRALNPEELAGDFGKPTLVCTENFIRVDDAPESPKLTE